MPGWVRVLAGRLGAAALIASAAVAAYSPPLPARAATAPPAAESATPKGDSAEKDRRAPGSSARKEDEEVELGRRVALQIERVYGVVKDAKQQARIERIGNDIAAVCEEPGYNYAFKILNTDILNALSLPGGFTYITKGMLDFVRSDDELAAVLGHEIAHAAHHHVKDSLRREAAMNKHVMLGVLGAVLLGQGRLDMIANVLMGAEAVKTAYMSEHSQTAESDADRTAVEYLVKTGKYNPVAVLTVMEQLAREEANRVGPPAGIFQTHPPGAQRTRDLEAYLTTRDIPIVRLAVLDRLWARARTATAEENQFAEVVLGEVVILQTRAGLAAAKSIADHLNRLLQRELRPRQVSVGTDGLSVVAGDETLFRIGEEDAALQGKPADQVAQESARALARALWKLEVEQVL